MVALRIWAMGGCVSRVEVSNDELHTVRDAMRELHRMVDALDCGELEKVVLTHRNRMRAVVLSIEEYAALSRARSAAETD
jgi:PHD/YefM family antitoxin component YafN of YafNO toxin-antitoxin module